MFNGERLNWKDELLTMQLFGCGTTTFIERDLSVLVGHRNQCSVTHQFFCDASVSPKTCIMQSCVAVLIDKVDVCFVFQEDTDNV